jgi:hypothetical protein
MFKANIALYSIYTNIIKVVVTSVAQNVTTLLTDFSLVYAGYRENVPIYVLSP